MMKNLIAIFLLVYFSLGVTCLPLGNFASLGDLPEMYRYCKAFEDKDMDTFDFVTDHLINIDGIFDDHGNGDDQRPHTPFTFHHFTQQHLSVLIQMKLVSTTKADRTKTKSIYSEPLYPSDFNSRIFRPPIV